jgi:hypothetical protein
LPCDARPRREGSGRAVRWRHRSPVRRGRRAFPPPRGQVPRPGERVESEDSLADIAPGGCGQTAAHRCSTPAAGAAAQVPPGAPPGRRRREAMGLPLDHQPARGGMLADGPYERRHRRQPHRPCAQLAAWCVTAPGARLQARSRSRWASGSCFSFRRVLFSIWRIRSRVTPNARPTSSRVSGSWPRRP